MVNKKRVDIEFDEGVFNERYFQAFKSIARWLVLYGGAGSGKSIFAGQKILIRIIQDPGHNALVMRKVGRTIRNSCFAQLKATINNWNMTKLFAINETDMVITFLPNGNKIISAGLDDVSKLKSIYNITMAWVEEATELSMNDLRQINLRLRGVSKHYKQIILTFNSIVGTAVHKMFFVDAPPANSEIIHTTYHNNRFIDDEYRQELEGYEKIDAAFHAIYAKGQFVELKGKIYPRFRTIPRDQWPAGFQHQMYGLDFGYTNPSVLLDIGYRDPYQLYLKQLIHESGLTNAALIQRLDRLLVNRQQPMYADPAEPDRIAEIAAAGYLIYPAQKDVADGIDFCMRFDIFSTDENVESNAEFSTYKWKENAAGEVVDGVPVKLRDHAPDALRYGAYTGLKDMLGKTKSKFSSLHNSTFGK
jgi:phage terminase large subunit